MVSLASTNNLFSVPQVHSRMFVFERFWIFFKAFNIFGVFPCYKENIDGVDYLKPTNPAWQFIKYLIFIGVFFVAPCTLAFVYNVTWEDLMKGALEAQTNETNKIVSIIILTCQSLEHFLSLFALYGIKQDLCKLQDFITHGLTLSLPSENFTFKLGTLMWFLPCVTSSFVFPLGFAKSLAGYLKYSTLGFVVTYISGITIYLGSSVPILTLLFLFFETFKFINQWLQKLHSMVEDPSEPTIKVLREIEKFCTQWKNIQSFISFPLFQLFTLSILQVIAIFYRSLSFFTNQEASSNSAFQVMGYLSMGAAMTYSFVFTSFYGQKIGDQVKALKEMLHDQFIIDPGESEEIIKMKKLAVYHLSCWENFDGYGFFTLGKSFLTSLLANFITYVIILIQFQLSSQ